MKIKSMLLFSAMSFIAIMTHSCVEPFEIETETFESILIVEGVITDEFKQQEVLVSKTFRIEESTINGESDAEVKVVDDQQNEYTFQETDPGKYVSILPFSAESGRSYQLFIKTRDGNSYTSESGTLPQKAIIDNVYAERIINDKGVDGISIFTDSSSPEDGILYYRYEYEETYQIIPPFWSGLDLNIVSEDPPEVSVVPRIREERVCYKTDLSNAIILSNTDNLSENSIIRFPVRFIEKDNPILRSRYSILVRQMTQSRDAQIFYETLREFSDPESLFSQTQPGFISGNISSTDNPEEKILGYFGISSVASKRVFFNFRDLFSNETRPPFFVSCNLVEVEFSDITAIIGFIKAKLKLVAVDNINSLYIIVPQICGDCNVLGSNIVPDFWED
ncbi:DUF4249 domain-containing protein [Aquimarina sp. RZ0]|uniref:DUF4249 domain-containing protein n=1 Tax=Aquimarina sp. RZ0 TaxID=2607730 RepID=UPI0011F0BE5E|nr:DUF4249 domain-containing protein [Aquimarina sp. RZ0]KAA1246784.1 DUF4249 domain-containing protein [Aquimarina sp. RZ0]